MNQTTVKATDPGPLSSSALSGYEPPYLAAGVAALAVWILYAITLAPTTAFWDTSEYIATAHILGIPHPPGNPTFVVLARAWELLLAPLGLSTAVRINLFSATMTALAHGCWFLVFHRIAAAFTPDRRMRLIGAGLAVLVSATAFTVWSQSNVNEKVYTVSLFSIALLTWLAFHWRDNLGQGKDDNLILLMIFVLALAVGNHLMSFLAAPALIVFILLVEPRTLGNWKLYVFGAAVALLGLSIHLYLPLRASLGPIINEADPSTWQALMDSLARRQYDKPSMFADPTDPSLPRGLSLIVAQIGNYFQYFDWQWGRSLGGADTLFAGVRPLFTAVFVALGLYGAYEHFRRDRASWWYAAILFATVSIGLVGYLNFKYGYSYPIPGGGGMEMREVRERDYFFIVSFSMWGLWAGLGVFGLWQHAAQTLGGRPARPDGAETDPSGAGPSGAGRSGAGRSGTGRSGRGLALASPILILAALPLLLNWTYADRSSDYSARDWAYNLIMSVEPYGVLFTNGDNDTFPLWYIQEVEKVRRDVTVIVMSYLNTPWYAHQVRQLTQPCPKGVDPLEDPTLIRCQRPFQPENMAGFYAPAESAPRDTGRVVMQDLGAGQDWQPPTRSILPMTEGRIDSIPLLYAMNPYNFLVEEAFEVQAGDITFTVPGNRFLLPADVFLLNIVQSSLGDRPIYFATTTQAYERIGLGPYLLRQGLALKLHNGSLQEDPDRGIHAIPDMIQVPEPFVDLPRTEALLQDVFVHRGGIPDEWGFWPEPSTTNIPWYYVFAHYTAYATHMVLGNEEEAAIHMDRFEAWRRLAEQ
jgi:hypothetical protein